MHYVARNGADRLAALQLAMTLVYNPEIKTLHVILPATSKTRRGYLL